MATVKAVVRNNRKNENGLYGIEIRFTKDRKTYYEKTNIFVRIEDWDAKGEYVTSGLHKNKKNAIIRNLLSKAEGILLDWYYEDYDHKRFYQELFNKRVGSSVFGFWIWLIFDLNKTPITMLEASEKAEPKKIYKGLTGAQIARKMVGENEWKKIKGNARLYCSEFSAMVNYRKGVDFRFYELTTKFLNDYEKYRREVNGAGDSGISVCMRTVRALYNKACKAGYADKNKYPFDNYKITKPTPVYNTLDLEDVRSFFNVEIDESLNEYRNLVKLSVYLRVMNFADIAELKADTLKKKRLVYVRKKLNRHKNPLSILISKDCKELMKKIHSGGDYLVGFFDSKNSNYVSRKTNQSIKSIAEIAEIPGSRELTWYTFRHSYATIARYHGIDREIIAELMGHKHDDITQVYLKRFPDRVIDEAHQKICDLIFREL